MQYRSILDCDLQLPVLGILLVSEVYIFGVPHFLRLQWSICKRQKKMSSKMQENIVLQVSSFHEFKDNFSLFLSFIWLAF